jgi:DNA-binding MarR family transcriptional regulator
VTTSEPGGGAAIGQLEQALSQLAYLVTRVHRNERIAAAAGVPLDRAAVVVLRRLATTGPMRPGELADALGVEAPHVSRQVHKLQLAGYVAQAADPGDLRARFAELTTAGEAAAERIAGAARRGIEDALANWSPGDLDQLSVLLRRMLDDFVAHSGADAPVPGADNARSRTRDKDSQ